MADGAERAEAAALPPSTAMEHAILEKVAVGVQEDMMVGMLDALQGAADACAKVCIQRMQSLHAQMNAIFEEELKQRADNMQGTQDVNKRASFYQLFMEEEEGGGSGGTTPASMRMTMTRDGDGGAALAAMFESDLQESAAPAREAADAEAARQLSRTAEEVSSIARARWQDARRAVMASRKMLSRRTEHVTFRAEDVVGEEASREAIEEEYTAVMERWGDRKRRTGTISHAEPVIVEEEPQHRADWTLPRKVSDLSDLDNDGPMVRETCDVTYLGDHGPCPNARKISDLTDLDNQDAAGIPARRICDLAGLDSKEETHTAPAAEKTPVAEEAPAAGEAAGDERSNEVPLPPSAEEAKLDAGTVRPPSDEAPPSAEVDQPPADAAALPAEPARSSSGEASPSAETDHPAAEGAGRLALEEAPPRAEGGGRPSAGEEAAAPPVPAEEAAPSPAEDGSPPAEEAPPTAEKVPEEASPPAEEAPPAARTPPLAEAAAARDNDALAQYYRLLEGKLWLKPSVHAWYRPMMVDEPEAQYPMLPEQMDKPKEEAQEAPAPPEPAAEGPRLVVASEDVKSLGLTLATLPPETVAVKNVSPDSWAHRVGIRTGTVITALNGIGTQDLDGPGLKNILRRRPLELQILKPAGDSP